MSTFSAVGRRERKKALTRTAILDAAQSLFLERGFDGVTVREIADKADVTPKTVFSHFPHKEALLFADEDERHERLASAVRDRAAQTTISDALMVHYLSEIAAVTREPYSRFLGLMNETPSLVEYAEKMWLRHEDTLLEVVTAEFGLTEPSDEIRFYVRFALQIQLMAVHDPDPQATIANGFRLLEEGWGGYITSTNGSGTIEAD